MFATRVSLSRGIFHPHAPVSQISSDYLKDLCATQDELIRRAQFDQARHKDHYVIVSNALFNEEDSFLVGEYVLVTPSTGRADKLGPKLLGPFKIIQINRLTKILGFPCLMLNI
jgi:hypothetical protein